MKRILLTLTLLSTQAEAVNLSVVNRAVNRFATPANIRNLAEKLKQTRAETLQAKSISKEYVEAQKVLQEVGKARPVDQSKQLTKRLNKITKATEARLALLSRNTSNEACRQKLEATSRAALGLQARLAQASVLAEKTVKSANKSYFEAVGSETFGRGKLVYVNPTQEVSEAQNVLRTVATETRPKAKAKQEALHLIKKEFAEHPTLFVKNFGKAIGWFGLFTVSMSDTLWNKATVGAQALQGLFF